MERTMSDAMPAQLDLLRDEIASLRIAGLEALERFDRSHDPRDLLASINLRLEAEAIAKLARKPGRWGG